MKLLRCNLSESSMGRSRAPGIARRAGAAGGEVGIAGQLPKPVVSLRRFRPAQRIILGWGRRVRLPRTGDGKLRSRRGSAGARLASGGLSAPAAHDRDATLRVLRFETGAECRWSR